MGIKKSDAEIGKHAVDPEYALDPNTLRLRRLKPQSKSLIRSLSFINLATIVNASANAQNSLSAR